MLTLPDPTSPTVDPSFELQSFVMPATSFTFEMEVALPANPASSELVSYGSEFSIWTWTDYLDVYLFGVRFDTIISTNALVGTTPHRVSITWDSTTGTATAYLDGIERGTAILSAGDNFTAGRTLRLGAGATSGDLSPSFSFGDIRVFDHVRSGAEIAANASGALSDPGTINGLVGYWTESGAGFASQVAGIGDIVLDEDILNYTRAPRPAVIATGDAEVDVMVDGLLMNSIYTSGNVITYTFELSHALPTDDGHVWTALVPEMEARARAILDQFTQLTGIACVEVSQNDQRANFYFAARDGMSNAYVSSHEGGIMHVFAQSVTEPVPGSYDDMTLLHEIGHGLGLAHGHDADSLPREYQGADWTVMSYRGHPLTDTLAFATDHGSETWMLADIAAIQYQFGANYTTNAGDTVYTFSPIDGQTFIDGVSQGLGTTNGIYRTIWDGGGSDTYDLSNYHSALDIDLTPGRFSTFSELQLSWLGTDPSGDDLYASGNVANAYMYQGDTRSLIENAIGGIGDDSLTGNQISNTLRGGAGADTLYGGGGNDVLEGDGGPASAQHGAEYGLALNNGVTGERLRATSIDVPQTAMTIAFDINFATAPVYQWFLDLPGVSFMFDPGNSGAPNLWVYLNGSWTNSGISVSQFGDGATHQYAFTWNSADGAFAHYFDGALIRGGTGHATGATLSATGVGTITFDPEGGSIGDIRVYDRALTASEIYTASVGTLANPAATNGLLHNWQVQSDGTVVEAAGGIAPVVSGTPAVSILVEASSSADTLWGEDGDDTLRGGQGSDQIYGGAGVDTLDGGTGADTMSGGDGNDTYYVDDADDFVEETLASVAIGGTDRVIASVTWTLPVNVENLTMVGTGDIVGNGNGSNNFMSGNAQANTLRAWGGNDVFIPGYGNDWMSGGLGQDYFVFNTVPGQNNRDGITDFVHADDTIRLENAIFTGLGPATGMLSAAMFHAGTAAHDADDRIIYNATNGQLMYDADGAGGVAAVLFATLTNLPANIDRTDFYII